MWNFPSSVTAIWEILWWERGFVWWREGAWFFELWIWLTQSTPGYVVPLACNVLCEPCSVCDQEGNSITPEKTKLRFSAKWGSLDGIRRGGHQSWALLLKRQAGCNCKRRGQLKLLSILGGKSCNGSQRQTNKITNWHIFRINLNGGVTPSDWWEKNNFDHLTLGLT